MREIAPGVWHWTAHHPNIGVEVHSYFLSNEGILIDPMEPEGGVQRVGEIAAPGEILLTNRHHYRASGAFRAAYGVPVRCHRAGLHEFTKGEEVEPFDFGDRFGGGVEAVGIGALCPEETAFHADREAGILALGDSAIRWDPKGPVGFVPDQYMGDDPAAVKKGLRESLGRILERDFGILLLAHGEPIVGDGKEVLRVLVEGGGAK
jgi:hypothetical protein